MVAPCSLCLEDLLTDDPDQRFLRCVALPGRQPGLRLLADGTVGWMTGRDVACELIVSNDQALLLYRPPGATGVVVSRAGRELRVPSDKPVVLIDADEVRVAHRRLRVHIHGETGTIVPPTPLMVRARTGAAAAMVALGAVTGCDRPPTVQQAPEPAVVVSAQPPADAVKSQPPKAPMSDADTFGNEDADVPSPAPAASSSAPAPPARPPPGPSPTRPAQPPKQPPIEVRDMPPFSD